MVISVVQECSGREYMDLFLQDILRFFPPKLMIQLGGRSYMIFSLSLGSQETGKVNKNVSD